MKKVYILLLTVATTVVSQAQPHRSWVQRYDGGLVQGGGDSSPLCASDSAGNIYVAGTTATYGLSPQLIAKNLTITRYDLQGMKNWVVTYERAQDVVAIKADRQGNVYILADNGQTLLLKYNERGELIWEWSYMGGLKNKALSMDIDNSGNVYVTSVRKHSPDSSDISMIKFSPRGVAVWSRQHTIGTDSGAKAFLDVDARGNIWLAFANAIAADHPEKNTGLIKYDLNGKKAWDRLCGDVNLNGLKADDHGNAYLLSGNLINACSARLTKFNSKGEDTWTSCDPGMDRIIKENALAIGVAGNVAVTGANHAGRARTTFFDSSGTGLWTHVLNIEGTSNAYPFAISFDDSGKLKIAGETRAADGRANYFTAQYSPGGKLDWVTQYDAPTMLNDRITGMSALPGGKVVITGESMYSQSKDFVTVCYSEQGLELWVNAVDGKSISMESATVQDIDPFTGDIYLAGYAKGRNLNSDMLTVKYKADGSFQWARYFEGPALEDDIASDIKTDGQGNVYVAGRTTESMAPRVNGLRLIKYDEQGNIVWNVVHADTGYMTEYPILAIGNDGSIYVCAGSANFTMMLLKYNSSGQLLWKSDHKAPGREGLYGAAGVKVDRSGNIYVAASSIPVIGTEVMSVLKYSADGNLLWMKESPPGGSISSKADDMEIDNNGNVYMSGHFISSDYAARFVTVKYDPNGAQEWMTISDPSQFYDHAFNDIAIDGTGNVYLMGRTIDPGNSRKGVTSTIKLDPAGQEQWRNTLGDAETSFWGYGIIINNSGTVFLTGYSYGDYFKGQWIFTAALSPSGKLEWIDTLAISTAGKSSSISIHPAGGIYVAGELGGFYEGLDLGLIRYEHSAVGNENIMTAASNNDFSIFPNPTPGSFTLWMNASGEVCIEVLDLSGKKVHCVNMKDGERSIPIEVKHLTAGSYVVRAVTKKGVITRPLIVMSE